jgi:hypothetical protein
VARGIFRHILPNCLPPLIVVATVQVANAIALEATLSFLGLGLPLTEPLLVVRDLATQFFTRTGVGKAVVGVPFGVARGEIVGLVGES